MIFRPSPYAPKYMIRHPVITPLYRYRSQNNSQNGTEKAGNNCYPPQTWKKGEQREPIPLTAN